MSRDDDDRKFNTPEKAYAEAERRIAEKLSSRETDLDVNLRYLQVLPPAISRLTWLRILRLNRTRVADLTPLAGCTALQTLDLTATGVADLTPLAGCTALRTLRLDGTGVADLTPLAGCTALQSLGLDGTRVADLAPLAGCTALQSLGLDGTRVADLAPLAGCIALQFLDLTGTGVADLAPLTEMRALCTGVQKQPETMHRYYGLNLDKSAVAKLVPFDRLVTLDQPARTIETINYVRRTLGKEPFVIEGYVPPDGFVAPGPKDFGPPDPPPVVAPPIPKQGEVVRFAENAAGQIDIDRGNDLPEADRSDAARRQQLLLRALDELIDYVPRSNGYGRLKEPAAQYRASVAKPLDRITSGDLDLMLFNGIDFKVAATDLAAEIKEGSAPEADRRLSAPLEKILMFHGPFVQEFAHGRNFFAAIDRERFDAANEAEFKDRERDAQAALQKASPHALTTQAAEVAHTAVEMIGKGPQVERSRVAGATVVNNKWKALGDKVVRWVQSRIIAPKPTLAGAVTTTVLAQGIAATPPGVAIVGAVKVTATTAMTGLAAAASAAGPIPAEIAAYMFNHAEQIRALATQGGPTFDWLRHFVDWLAKVYPGIAGGNR